MLTPMMYNVGRERHSEWLHNVADLVDRAGLNPLVDPRRFSLADATAAYDYAATGKTQGKVVIDVAEVTQ